MKKILASLLTAIALLTFGQQKSDVKPAQSSAISHFKMLAESKFVNDRPTIETTKMLQ